MRSCVCLFGCGNLGPHALHPREPFQLCHRNQHAAPESSNKKAPMGDQVIQHPRGNAQERSGFALCVQDFLNHDAKITSVGFSGWQHQLGRWLLVSCCRGNRSGEG